VFAVWWRNEAAGCGIPRAGLLSAAKAVNRQRSRTSALESIADLRRKLARGAGGNLDTAAGALTSPANFPKGHGWRAGAGYQPGEAIFGGIQTWNAAPVYQRAIAINGRQIDGG